MPASAIMNVGLSRPMPSFASKFFFILLLIKAKAAIHGKVLSGYIPRVGRCKKEQCGSDVIWLRHFPKGGFFYIIVDKKLLLIGKNSSRRHTVDPDIFI